MIHTGYPVPSVNGALLNERGEVLLTKRSQKVWFPGNWCLPGGHLDGGDDWVSALMKEMREEIGIVPVTFRLYGIYSEPKAQMLELEGRPRQYLTACFLVSKWDGEVVINDESDTFGWFPRDGLPGPLLKSEPPKIEDAFDFRGKVFVR